MMSTPEAALGSVQASPAISPVAAIPPVESNVVPAGLPVVNYFANPAAAARYASGRPQCHGLVLDLLRRTLGGRLPVSRALDVGCGTGHSTHALLPLAETVVGIDASSVMLAQAQPHARIEYRKGHAEALPFRRGEFDLVAVSSAYHWFDQERFLTEAARVLRPAGWLVLYKIGATGRLTHDPEFVRWRREVLNVQYPKVARHSEHLTAATAGQFGFQEVMCEEFRHQQRHTLEDYVENLLTHSSVIRVVDFGRTPASAARAWLRAELGRFFPQGEAEFTHEAWIHVWQRT